MDFQTQKRLIGCPAVLSEWEEEKRDVRYGLMRVRQVESGTDVFYIFCTRKKGEL